MQNYGHFSVRFWYWQSHPRCFQLGEMWRALLQQCWLWFLHLAKQSMLLEDWRTKSFTQPWSFFWNIYLSCIRRSDNNITRIILNYLNVNWYITAEWGVWGPWGYWSSCSTVCGAGQRTRIRSCYSHYPGVEGLECIGEETEDSLCDKI